MAKIKYSRRDFIVQNSVLGAGAMLSVGASPSVFASNSDVPAILGGKPVHSTAWPKWPMWNPETDEKRVIDVLRSGQWSRGKVVSEFEDKWAAAIGAKRCLTLVNGTNALIVSLLQLGIGAGDEVILPPYTFIATADAILACGAIPVFADIDPETFQIDPKKIEAKITPRTKALLPVHICGLPADMTSIMRIAKAHNLLVVEDACQAWLAEINQQKVGTFGDAGCFSFQNSKNIPMGEGGAIVSNDDAFMDRCFSYHNYGGAYGSVRPESTPGFVMAGTKLRLTEYQAAIGLSQFERLESQTDKRIQNAEYLKSIMMDIPGITPYKLYNEVTRAVFHLFPFRYHKDSFKGLSRSMFLKALNAEGINSSSGYATLNTMPFLKNAFLSKNYQRMYTKEELDIDTYYERNACPVNDKICNEEAVWFSQNMLLGDKNDMDLIGKAIVKISKNAEKIKKLDK